MDSKHRRNNAPGFASPIDNTACVQREGDRQFANTTSIHIDEAWGSDLAALTRLAENAIRTSVPIDKEEMRDVFLNVSTCLQWAMDNPNACVFLQCTVHGRLVGIALVKHFWNLCCLFVEPTSQRSGLGKALVTEAVRRSLTKTEDALMKVNASPNAVGFYQALGFVRDHRREPRGSSTPMLLDLRRWEEKASIEA